MTAEETIKELEHLLKVEKDRIHKDMVIITALENAVKAVEKQIPKLVEYSDKIEYSDNLEYCCPECRCILCFKEKLYYKFCPYCGQALDWSGEDE